MRVLYLILLIAAGACFALAVVLPTPVTASGSVTDPPRRPFSVNLVALGLLFWVLVPLIQQADRIGD